MPRAKKSAGATKGAGAADAATATATATATAGASAGAAGTRTFRAGGRVWQIDLTGATLTLRYGTGASDLRTTVKEFDSEASARHEHDKLVAEKTKNGYVEGSS